MKIFKKGDNVIHEFLGTGEVIKNVEFMTLVLFDDAPPIKYNLGENPCAVFTKELKHI